jgi:hypothetical protein
LSGVSCGDGSATERVKIAPRTAVVLFFDHGDDPIGYPHR